MSARKTEKTVDHPTSSAYDDDDIDELYRAIEEYGSVPGLDAQQHHDITVLYRDRHPQPVPKDSRQRLEALLRSKQTEAEIRQRLGVLDPIASAMKRHPGLTLEQASKDAEDFGF